MSDEGKRNKRKTMVGIVTSDKMDKTIVVEIQRTVIHPVFKKYLKRRTRFQAHDEQNEAGLGDKVEVMESRPLSKRKSFRLVKVLSKARIPASTPKLEETLPATDLGEAEDSSS